MEILIIPDLHGRSFWEKPYADLKARKREFDQIIFMGDYFDPYAREGIDECQAIINWERLYDTLMKSCLSCFPVFLIGNHDAHYINNIFAHLAASNRMSKYHLNTIKGIFADHRSMMQLAYETSVGGRKMLFTHAGVNRQWVERHRELIGEVNADNLNKLTKSDEGWRALADVGSVRGGRAETGGPLWADVHEHYDADGKPYAIDGYDYEIFAHSQQEADPIINDKFAMLDVRRPFVLDDHCVIHEYDEGE